MAYSVNNLRSINTGIDYTGNGVWVYSSSTAFATVAGATYISNAADVGMKAGDWLIVIDTATPKITSAQITAVASTGPTVSTGVQIS